MKRLEKLHQRAQENSLSEFIFAHPYPVLVVLQVHEGNLVHRPPDHEATVSHKRLPWADVGYGQRASKRSTSLGQAARATMHHEGDDEDSEINLEGLFTDSPGERLPTLTSSSRYVSLRNSEEMASPHLVIGRSSSCDVVINDYSVSKVHLRITQDIQLKRTMVTDLGSRNGTYMDEHRLEKGRPALLRSTDEIRIGRMTFIYLEPADLHEALNPVES